MTKEEFLSKMNKWAEKYARQMIYNPDKHLSSVREIISDYMEGAIDAYKLLTQNYD